MMSWQQVFQILMPRCKEFPIRILKFREMSFSERLLPRKFAYHCPMRKIVDATTDLMFSLNFMYVN